MVINGIPFTVELYEILEELQMQLHLSGINLLNKIKDTDDNVMISCPYHKNGQERKPSAGIRKSDGQFHCFTCGEVHTLPEMISFCFGHPDDMVGAKGWQWLTRNFLTVDLEERKPIKLDFDRHKSILAPLNYVSEEELESYRYYHPYMFKRKMTEKIIDIFDIGYDKKSKCITFPVRDIEGNTLFIARRSVKYKYFNYPKSVEKPLYGLYELYRLEQFPTEVIVCESMIDAITCWVYGKYAVALNGLGNNLQFNQLNKLPCRKLVLATDNDNAGLRARKRIKYYVKNKIITEYVFPNNRKDINDLSQEEFKNLIEKF